MSKFDTNTLCGMGNIKITKKDIIWGYIAQFFSIGSGLITLPLVLRMLSTEEIGMNYLMLTIGSLVALFDFGFAPQFGRNISYIFGGTQELKKEGIAHSTSGEINYKLLATMVIVAKSFYRILAISVLVIMLTFGSFYIYKITNGFSNINNSLEIWVLYSFSIFFNLYFTYYTSLLVGKGLIQESKKAMLVSRLVYIGLTFVFLYIGWGLLGVTLANLISPFVSRYMSHCYFFTNELQQKLSSYCISKREKHELFMIVWYNAKKLGLVFVGSYAVNKFGMFLSGLYLSLGEVASYGLMIQFMGIITIVSGTFFSVSEPQFAVLRVENNVSELIRKFSFTMNLYYILFIVGCLFLILFVPFFLRFVGSNATLPSLEILLIYSIIILLENNHSLFSSLIITNNKIPFVESSLLAGAAICISDFMLLRYTSLGILGLVMIQGIWQLAYANWKWPYVVCREFKISFLTFLSLGMSEFISKLKCGNILRNT